MLAVRQSKASGRRLLRIWVQAATVQAPTLQGFPSPRVISRRYRHYSRLISMEVMTLHGKSTRLSASPREFMYGCYCIQRAMEKLQMLLLWRE